MKRLKVKTINCDFNLIGGNSASQIKKFDDRINEFLSTLDAENIYQVSYLNSSSSVSSCFNPRSILMAVITYFEDQN